MVGERRVEAGCHVRIAGAVVEGRQGDVRAFDIHLDAQVGLQGILPFQVRVVDRLRRIGVVGIERRVGRGAGRGKSLMVAIGRRRIEHLEGRQLDTLTPSDMDAEVTDKLGKTVLPENVAAVDTRRETAYCAIF